MKLSHTGWDRPGPLRTWLCEYAHRREAPFPTHPRSSCPDPFLTPLTTDTAPWPTVWSWRVRGRHGQHSLRGRENPT